MIKRKIAVATGICLLLMAIIAGYSIGYAYPEFYQQAHLELSLANFKGKQALYKNMLLGILIILILDFLVSYSLYKYFENESKALAKLAGVVRIIYTVIFAIATWFLVKNLRATDLTNEMVNLNFEQFQAAWNGGLIVFGFHVLLVGWLMILHRTIPKVLYILTLFAGFCYIVLHVLKLACPDLSIITNLEMILALPMAAGELGLAIWFLVKGGKQPVKI